MQTNDKQNLEREDAIGYGYAPLLHAVSLCITLVAVWLGLSGFYTPLLLSLGAASVALSIFVAMRMDLTDHEGMPIQFGPRIIIYWLWLLKEIVKANIDVARRVIQRDPDISPTLFVTKASQTSDVGRVVFANSITLTPGTVSVVLEDDSILVHALTQGGADDLLTGEMDRRVSEIER